MHHRVADEGRVQHIRAFRAHIADELADQRVDRIPHHPGEVRQLFRVHLDVGHPRHQVFAEADLRIGGAGGGNRAAGLKVAEMGGNGRGADIDGKAINVGLFPRPERGDHWARGVVLMDRSGHRPVTGAQGRLNRGEQGRIQGQAGQARLFNQRVPQPVGIAARGLHVRFS